MLKLSINFVQNKQAVALFGSGASFCVISEKLYKHLPYAANLLKPVETAIINASENNLGRLSQFYFTSKLGKKTFTDKFYIL